MRLNKKQLNKFWGKVQKTNGCWNWIGALTQKGYGNFRYGYKQLRVHRLSWMMHNGKISKDLLVCHSCDNPKCVNPKHLFLGTHSDNRLDMYKKGRRKMFGENHPRAKLKKADVIDIRNLYKNNPRSLLAKQFNTSISNIGLVINYKRWL